MKKNYRHYDQEKFLEALENIDKKKTNKILDLGSGKGDFTHEIQSVFKGSRITATKIYKWLYKKRLKIFTRTAQIYNRKRSCYKGFFIRKQTHTAA
ncbi:MAG: hypothetical protein KJ583_04080 [Nanoarchaeota archaeon]|nr:hypothetical protein [Nanoarchaeota archaeon]MBU1270123.1 hypothetical protein [Nanoarchaeota archaeon]MBU1604471.1 hypothetical protein [Nanoarchaeota archaeon]MBU2442455.1 hypothetical protein [Nanoarchaeota archaeon]